MQTIILAGGLGTRLRSLLPDTPKPMAPIQNRPFLAMLLDYLGRQGVNKVILSVGYKHEVIQSWFGNRYGAIDVDYSIESEPLGTGGAIKKSLRLVNDGPLFVINGDTFLQLNYRDMLASHIERGAQLSIALRAVDNTSRYGSVKLHNNEIVSFAEKAGNEAGLINSGIYLLSRNIFDDMSLPDAFSFEREFLYPYLQAVRPQAFLTDGYFIDIGVPEDYLRAQHELPSLIDRLQPV